MNDPTLHAGWHFRLGQDDAPLWWGVAVYAGLALVIEPDAVAQVPQIDESNMHSVLTPEEMRAYLAAEAFVRADWALIEAAGHCVYSKRPTRKPLPGTREFWMVDPGFLMLAYDIAKGYTTDGTILPKRYRATMRAMLSASRQPPTAESPEIAAEGLQAGL